MSPPVTAPLHALMRAGEMELAAPKELRRARRQFERTHSCALDR